MLTVNTELFWILVAVTAAVLMQAFVLLGILLTMRKAVQTAKQQSEEYRAKLTPILDDGGKLLSSAKDLVTSTQSLLQSLKPRVETAAGELADITTDLHAQVNRLQAAVDDVALKARHQADRVDVMTTSFLNGLDRFGTFLNEAVHAPIRQVNGFVAAAKAVVDTLRAPAPPRTRLRPAPRAMRMDDDKDLFV
jgi:hypothetical protein